MTGQGTYKPDEHVMIEARGCIAQVQQILLDGRLKLKLQSGTSIEWSPSGVRRLTEEEEIVWLTMCLCR